jgi:hypothetical protein
LQNAFRRLFSAGDVWFDASNVTPDGVSGKMLSMVDYIDSTHLLTQADTTKQYALPSANANFGGALTVTGTGSTWHRSNRSNASWAFADRAGTLVCVFRPTSDALRIMLSTSANTAAGGLDLTRSAADSLRLRAVGPSSSTTTGWTVNTATYVRTSLGSAAWEVFRKSASVASGTGTLSTDTANVRPLTTGEGTTFNFEGEIRAIYAFQRVIDAADWLTVQQFIQADTGITP